MDTRIEVIEEKKFVGMRLETSLSKDKTRELWETFMPMMGQIKNRLDSGFYSINIFGDLTDFRQFTPHTLFERWAAVEVSDFEGVPDEMETYLLPPGKYAVFIHKGPASNFVKTSQYIFASWLPNSKYELDLRAHFEIMGENYRPDDPNATEEIWIPIR
ncbi:MAG: GyrI-like domain-containing protein [Deltaproteobacteria bacterium]|nr:GyrI-like domain-containing protein [Deltaproteobacteria bacterium]